jgi:methionyl-tRNA formyltransferase
MKEGRAIFMGSPDFALPVLDRLIQHTDVVGVVTQPDRPAGRGKMLTPPPVKELALAHQIPVIQPERLKDPNAKAQLEEWKADLIVVAAFGQILRQWVLDLPRYGCINVHGSLLPRWRGASPIQAAILHGDGQTGITIMRMDAGIDTGDMLAKQAMAIESDDTTVTLSARMAEMGADLLIDLLPRYLAGEINPEKQNDAESTYTGMIRKEDSILNLEQTAVELERKVRAYQPWPIARINLHDVTLGVLKATAITCSQAVAGIPYIINKSPAVGTASGLLVLDEVQPAGKKAMPGKAFLNGIKNWGEVIS